MCEREEASLAGGGQRISKSFWLTVVVSAVTTLPLLGCADHIFRSFNIDHGESLSVDARQRVILVTHKGGKMRDRTVVCTEPPPDDATGRSGAGSVVATVDPEGPGKGAQAAVATAPNEAMAVIAQRSQTIRLLRDGLYRACEAYLNGAIDQHQYNVVLLNIDKVMVTLLGIDAIGSIQFKDQASLAPVDPSTALDPRAGVAPGSKELQTGALTEILFAANAQSSAPALCLSLLASGELRPDNPAQQAVLARCDYLLAGTFEHLVRQRPEPAARHGAPAPPKIAVAQIQENASTTRGTRTGSAIGQWNTSMALPNAEHPDGVRAQHAWEQWTIQFY